MLIGYIGGKSAEIKRREIAKSMMDMTMAIMAKEIVGMITTIADNNIFIMRHYEDSGAFFCRYFIPRSVIVHIWKKP